MTQAQIFEHFMSAVWNGICDVSDDENRKLYDDCSDACAVADCMSAKRQGGLQPSTDAHEAGATYLFPDGSTVWVVIGDDGVGQGIEHNLP